MQDFFNVFDIENISFILYKNIFQAFVSAFLSVLLAIPGGYIFSKYKFKFKKTLYSLFIIPFILPTIIVILSVITSFGKNGFITNILNLKGNYVYSFFGIIFAHIFFNLPYALRSIADGFSSIDDRYYMISSNLGVNNLKSFLKITIPLLIPSIISSFIVIFILCFMSFGIILVFGGIQYPTLEYMIYKEMASLKYVRASFYAFIQLIFSILFIFINSKMFLKKSINKNRTIIKKQIKLKNANILHKILFFIYLFFIIVLILVPILTLFLKSLNISPNNYSNISLKYFINLFQSQYLKILKTNIFKITITSIIISISSGLLTFIITFLIAKGVKYRKNIQWMILIPMGISLVTLSLGFKILYLNNVYMYFRSYINLFSIILIILAQSFISFPIIYRLVQNTIDNYHSNYSDSGRILGLNKKQILFKIELPIMLEGLKNAFFYSVALSFADFTSVYTIGGGKIVTFPIAIYRLLPRHGFNQAIALSIIYIFITFLIFYLMDLKRID